MSWIDDVAAGTLDLSNDWGSDLPKPGFPDAADMFDRVTQREIDLANRIVHGVATVAGGTATVPTTDTTNTYSVNVTFPAGLFSSAPAVTVTQTGPNPDRASVSVDNITKTGCTIYAKRTVGSVTTSVQWIAAQNAA